MADKEIYNAIFISPDTISDIRDRLSDIGVDVLQGDREISAPHITLEYRGAESLSDYFGASADIKVTGYSHDGPPDSDKQGAVEGVSVEIIFKGDNAEFLQTKFEDMENVRNETCGRECGFDLHITMSTTDGMPPVETGYCYFEALPEDKQFVIEGGVFGGFMGSVDGEPVIDIGDKEYSELSNDIIDISDYNEDTSPDADIDNIDNIDDLDYVDNDDDYGYDF